MVRLVYSNRIAELFAELATGVRAQQNRDGALTPVRIVVPNAEVKASIRLEVARVVGIAANLDFMKLTELAEDVVGSAFGARVADSTAIEAMALEVLLDDDALEHVDLAPVRTYLRGGGDASDPMDVRRVQLAARVGRLFEEYTYSRGEMLVAWQRAASNVDEAFVAWGDARAAETAAWQRRLWLLMFGERGLAARRAREGRSLVPLNQAVASLDPGHAGEGILPATIHVFGFAHVARAFLELIHRLGRAVEIIVYALSPCEGFWEDADPKDPVPLRLWARPGREQVRAWNAIAGFDHDDRFVDPGASTLLHRIQSDVLRREPPRATAAVAASTFARDDTIVVIEHASVRRELEAVASEIWRLMEADDTLRLDEIAVLIPGGEANGYASQVPGVFRECYDLPCRVSAAAPSTRGGGVVEAIALLLSLPLGKFTRQEVMRLVMHRAIVATTDDADPARWPAWCEALGMLHGVDRTDHQGTYIERDVLNWDQGLRRLALGAFMTGDASGDDRPFEANGEAYIPYEVSSGELHDAAAFGLLVRSLLADATFARDARLTMQQWAPFLHRIVDAYVVPAGQAEEEQLARCLRCVHALGDVDVGNVPVRYRIACEIARRRLDALPDGTAGEGVIVSTLAALRPRSFRVVFACGMGEGQFPSEDVEDPLDLRWVRRREGDVTARERDKYGFLELLLGTRDRLYLSYVSREPLTGDRLAPSSVVEELLHTIEQSYGVDSAWLRRRHPLRRWAPDYYPDLFGVESVDTSVSGGASFGTMRMAEARAEARTVALRRSLDQTGERLAPADVLARVRDGAIWGDLAEHLGLALLPDAAGTTPGRLTVPLHAIVKFLEFPLQGWARFGIGLDERDDDDPMVREDEPFETEARREVLFLREVLLASIARRCSIDRAYDDAVRARELRGAGPSGVFARAERSPHLEILASWCNELVARGQPIDAIEVVRFGRSGERALASRAFEATSVDVDVTDPAGVTRMLRVDIVGRTLPMGVGAGASITLAKRPKQTWDDPWVAAERDRAALRAFADHALLSASGVAAGRRHESLLVMHTPDGPASERVSFGPLSTDEATAWFRAVLREMLRGPHAYFFPCEAIFVRARSDPSGPFATHLENARARLRDAEGPLALRSAYGPVPRPQSYPPPDEERACAMAVERFGLFFRKMERSP